MSDDSDEEVKEEIKGDFVESEFIIDGIYNVTGIGFVVGGTIIKGTILKNQTLMLGPDKNGHFKPVTVKGI